MLRLLSDIRYHENSYHDARLLLHEALGEDHQPEFEVPVRVALAEASFNAGDMAAALAHARAALDRAEHLGNHGLLAEALAQVGAAQIHTGDRAGWEKLDRAVTLEDGDRAGPIQLRPSVIVAELTAYEGRLHDAAKRMYELRASFAERGEESDLPHLLFYIAWLEWYRGHYGAALDAMEEAVTLAEQADSDTMLGYALANRAHAYVGAGQIAAARVDLDRARVLLEPTGWPAGMWMLTWTTGFMELSLGNLDAARAELALAVDLLEMQRPIWVAAGMVLFDAVEVLVGRGELARAEALLDPYEAWFDELDFAWLIAAAARCRALLLAAGGDLEGALTATEVALSLEDQLEMPLELARTLLVTGQVQRRAKRRGAGAVSRARPGDLRADRRAALGRQGARAELDRLGAVPNPGSSPPPRHALPSRPPSVTPTARSAAQLFLSRRTVEANLARAVPEAQHPLARAVERRSCRPPRHLTDRRPLTTASAFRYVATTDAAGPVHAYRHSPNERRPRRPILMRPVPVGVDVTVEPPQTGTREITIVLRIIVDDSGASAAPSTSDTTLPLYFAADVNASTAVGADVEHHRRRSRSVLVGAGAATFAALAALMMMTTSPRSAPVTAPPLAEIEPAPTSALTNAAILSALEPAARRYVEGIMALTPVQLAATFGNGPIDANKPRLQSG